MFKYLKIILFLFALSLSENVNAKPVPPGAGDGEVAANILILVDSSASMGRWIGGDGLGSSSGVTYSADDKIYIGQNGRRSRASLLRYNANGTRDNTFRPLRAIGGAGCSVMVDQTRVVSNRLLRKVSTVKFVENLSSIGGINENVIFMASRENALISYVFGFSENRQCLIAISGPDRHRVYDFDIKTIGGTPYIFMAGEHVRGWSSYFKSCNLNTMECEERTFNDRNFITGRMARLSVNNEGTSVLFSDDQNGNLVGYNLVADGNAYVLGALNRTCSSTNNPVLTTQMMFPFGVEISPEDSNIVYTTSRFSHAVQKLQLQTDGTCDVITSIGSGRSSRLSNDADPNQLKAEDVLFRLPWGLHVKGDGSRVLVSSSRGYVDEFDEDKFTVGQRDSSWLQQMGGPRIRRWDGVKSAINAIVNDTTLTTGAYFGFGHWNAGEHGRGKRSPMGGRHCHFNDDCNYYQAWSGTHPEGTSLQCNRDSCLNVAISPRGANLIMNTLEPLGLAWGTDSQAFSQIAEEYFNDASAGKTLINDDAPCQLNYIIVIGDGAMTNTGVTIGNNVAGGDTADRVNRMRQKGIKSLYVAYGGGITGTNLQRFHELARIGSSNASNAAECEADPDCEEAIVALTPTDLKTALTSKIRQIIAQKLAFTAPSISASVAEGGSLYQAQFDYQQYGEWTGTILRRSIDGQGNVDINNELGKNWSAAPKIKLQSSAGEEQDDRNIWSAIDGAPYFENWDNFNVSNKIHIADLFDKMDFVIQDYHTSTALNCPVSDDDPLTDELTGLINFMKGNDYFDYDGDCDLEEVREKVMGDIYHSQIIEVGPPDMNVEFNGQNEEAYYRSIKGYKNFMLQYAGRDRVVYGGANSGCLHAIAAKDAGGYEEGEEIWCFIPPFIASRLPTIINPDYQGSVGENNKSGGTNPIFGVDGSPVVHDVFIQGYDQNGNLQGSKSWRTVLFIPYGRGGAGFSILDITNPYKPIHMVSIFNDKINQQILISDVNGRITSLDYNATAASLLNSSEGEVANDNYIEARDADELEGQDVTRRQDDIRACVSTDGFKDSGTNSCFKSKVFHFPEIILDYPIGTKIPDGILSATELIDNVPTPIVLDSAEMTDDGAGGAILKVTFNGVLTFNANPKDDTSEQTNNISISACKGGAGVDLAYDYSTLGETWSTPRIVRMPTSSTGSIESDRYIAVLPGGMGKNDVCAGSAVFLVDLEGHSEGKPGSIYGYNENGGAITIVDTTPNGITAGPQLVETPNGSDIRNSIPATPVVITPDTAPNIPWRGALVYINDLEGKITKLNLSNNTKGFDDSGALVTGVTSLYDQTTLFRLNASEDNARYSFFGMDAGIGVSDGGFWLFGSTGNFTDLGNRQDGLDNILFGVQDLHYPYWKHLNGVKIPKAVTSPGILPLKINGDFLKKAHKGANDTKNHVGTAFNKSDTCENVTGDDTGTKCPLPDGKHAWVIHLEKGSDTQNAPPLEPRTYRKASASPTLFKGIVYYPVYQPPDSGNPCDQGHAFICAADDECGTNDSAELGLTIPEGENITNHTQNSCAYVSKGVLSELVVYAGQLYANVAGPSDDADTLFQTFYITGEVITNKGGWRDSSF